LRATPQVSIRPQSDGLPYLVEPRMKVKWGWPLSMAMGIGGNTQVG
jgi:hypothetical protein